MVDDSQTDHGRWTFPSDLLVDVRPQGGHGLRERFEHGLRAAIQSQQLRPGSQLPATRVLATELGISRSVVVEAYSNLISDGYLESRQGSGTRVTGDPRDEPARTDRVTRQLDRRTFYSRPRQASPRGAPPIRLLGGLPDPTFFPRARWVGHYRTALSQLPDPELTYPGALGAEALRSALTAYVGRVRGVSTSADLMLITSGFTQALALICRALRRNGATRVAIEDPCFGLHRKTIAMTGLEPVPIAVDAAGLDPLALDGVDLAAVLVAPAHSYPTGATLAADRRRALVSWARQHDALIIEDDYDAEFRYDRVPIGALQGLAPDRVAYVGCASKTVTPALRLGWLAAPQPWIRAFEREKHFDDMGSALLEQIAFARFVESGDFARHLRRVRPLYRQRRHALVAALGELMPDASWQGTSGGLHLHVGLPPGTDERALAAEAYERGVLIEDAAWHWARPREAPPSLVIGYGSVTEPQIRRAIAIVAASLAAITK